jgi:hypothetical protein
LQGLGGHGGICPFALTLAYRCVPGGVEETKTRQSGEKAPKYGRCSAPQGPFAAGQ